MEKINFYFSSIAFAYLGEEKGTLLSRLFYNTVNAGFKGGGILRSLLLLSLVFVCVNLRVLLLFLFW